MTETTKTSNDEILRQELSATRQTFQSDKKHIWCIAIINDSKQLSIVQSVRKTLPIGERLKMVMVLVKFAAGML